MIENYLKGQLKMFETTKVNLYIQKHNHEVDKIMQDIFSHWNAIGKLSEDEEKSNFMQLTFLVSIIKIWVKTSGMPRELQKEVMQKLVDSL